jgi:hypothetical protein
MESKNTITELTIKQLASEDKSKGAVEGKETAPLFSLETTKTTVDLVERFENDVVEAISKQTELAKMMHAANEMYHKAVKKGQSQATIDRYKSIYNGLAIEFVYAQSAVSEMFIKFQKSVDGIVAEDPDYETDDEVFDREEAALRAANDKSANL